MASIVPEGHWRIANSTDAPYLRCLYRSEACPGGNEYGDFLCDEKFSGLLCGKPSSSYHLDWTLQDSTKCTESNVVASLLIPVMTIIGILLLTLNQESTMSIRNEKTTIFQRIRSQISFRFTAAQSTVDIESCSSQEEQVEEHNLSATNKQEKYFVLQKLKIVIFVLQVSSSIPSTLHSSFGVYSSYLLKLMSYMTLSSLRALPWTCYPNSALFSRSQGSREINYAEQMEISTIFTLVSIFLMGFIYLIHMEGIHLTQPTATRRVTHRCYTEKYGALIHMLLCLTGAGVWALTSGVLFTPCVDTDPDGAYPDRDLSVMLADVSISCASGVYKSAYLWSIVATLLFVVFIPALQAVILHMYRDKIMEVQPSRRSVGRDLLQHTNTSNEKKIEYSSGEERNSGSSSSSSSSSSSENDSESDYEDERMKNTNVAACDRHKHISEKKRKWVDKKNQLSFKIEKYIKNDILRQRHASLYFPGFTLLYQAYWKDCRFWDMYRMLALFFYVAILPALFPYKNPAQSFIGTGVTMVFLQRVLSVKPFVSEEDQCLAVVGLIQIMFLFICALARELNLQDMHLFGVPLLDVSTCIVLVATPVSFLRQTLWRQTLSATEETATPSPPRAREMNDFSTRNGTDRVKTKALMLPPHRVVCQLSSTSAKHQRLPSNRTTASTAAKSSNHLVRHTFTRGDSLRVGRSKSMSGRNRSYRNTSAISSGSYRSPPRRDFAHLAVTPTHSRRPTSQLKNSPGGSLHYPILRDLATCTHETVTYDVMSSEKKNKRKQLLRQSNYYNNNNIYRSDSNVEEEKCDWSTESDSAIDDSSQFHVYAHTPPSPLSTPPFSDQEDEEDEEKYETSTTHAYHCDMNYPGYVLDTDEYFAVDHRQFPSFRPVAPSIARLNIFPLGSQKHSTSYSLQQPQQSLQHQQPQQYAATATAAATPHFTPLYSSDALYTPPRYQHDMYCDTPHFYENTPDSQPESCNRSQQPESPLVSYGSSQGIFPHFPSCEYEQAAYPYEPQLDFALVRDIDGYGESLFDECASRVAYESSAGAHEETSIAPNQIPSSKLHDECGELQEAAGLECGSVYSGSTGTKAASAIETMFSNRRACRTTTTSTAIAAVTSLSNSTSVTDAFAKGSVQKKLLSSRARGLFSPRVWGKSKSLQKEKSLQREKIFNNLPMDEHSAPEVDGVDPGDE